MRSWLSETESATNQESITVVYLEAQDVEFMVASGESGGVDVLQ